MQTVDFLKKTIVVGFPHCSVREVSTKRNKHRLLTAGRIIRAQDFSRLALRHHRRLAMDFRYWTLPRCVGNPNYIISDLYHGSPRGTRDSGRNKTCQAVGDEIIPTTNQRQLEMEETAIVEEHCWRFEGEEQKPEGYLASLLPSVNVVCLWDVGGGWHISRSAGLSVLSP